jgi:hypothetical protein
MITQHENWGGTWSQDKGRPWKKRTVAGVMALTRWSGIGFGSCLWKVGCFGLLSIIATRKPLVMAELAAISQHRNQRNQNLYTSWNLPQPENNCNPRECKTFQAHFYLPYSMCIVWQAKSLPKTKNNWNPRECKLSKLIFIFFNVHCMTRCISRDRKTICNPTEECKSFQAHFYLPSSMCVAW